MKNVFIVNKGARSGKGAEVWAELEEYLNNEKVQYEVYFTEKHLDATAFAYKVTERAIVTNEEVSLFVMGGDGTLNEALNGINFFEKTFYIPLPAGSANDYVKGIGLEGSALDILKRALASEEYKLFDVGKIICPKGVQYFGVSAGIGVDAFVCYQALTSKLKKFLNKIGLGQATYGLLTVGDIFTMPFEDAKVTYWFKGEKTEMDMKDTIFCAAMNCRAEGGGIPMAPNARPDSGYLTAFYAHGISRLKCFSLLPLLVAGKHEGKKGFELLNFDKMEIQVDSRMCVHMDGEHVGFYDKITFECMPQILKIRGF